MTQVVGSRKFSTVQTAQPAVGDKVVGSLAGGGSRNFIVGGTNGLARNGADGVELRDKISALEAGQATGQINVETWTDLQALTGAQGVGANVINDAGTHVDPVTSAADTPNQGAYVWDATAEAWKWVRADALALKADADRVSALEGDVAALDERTEPYQSTDAWSPGLVIEDAAGNKVIDISPAKIDHPDMNQVRGAAQAGAAAAEHVDTELSWQSGIALYDALGNKVIDILPESIKHPEIDKIYAAIGTGSGAAQSQRQERGFAAIGDSRIVQMYVDSGKRVKSGYHWFNVTNAMLGQPMRIAYHNALSGHRSDQYLPFLPSAIASNAKNLIIWGVVNDISQGYTAQQCWNGYTGASSDVTQSDIGIKAAIDTAVAAGMRVIIPLDPGSEALSAAQVGEILKYNALVREYAEEKEGLEVLDIPAAVWGGSTSTTQIGFKPGYLMDGDQTHPGILGAHAIAPLFAALVSRFVAPFQQLPASSVDLGGAGQQVLQNALFETASGGTAGSGVTGTVPAHWNISVSGTATVTAIEVNPMPTGDLVPNEEGYELVLHISGAVQGDTVRARYDLNVAGEVGLYPAIAPGDIYQAGVEIGVDDGSSNFLGAWLWTQYTYSDATFSTPSDGYVGPTMGIGPSTETDSVWKTEKFTVPAGKTVSSAYFRIDAQFKDAGSAVIRIRRPWMRKRYS